MKRLLTLIFLLGTVLSIDNGEGLTVKGRFYETDNSI